MDAAFHLHAPGRGSGLILAHCAALGDAPLERMPPFARLEAIVGGELARLLVYALAGAVARRAEILDFRDGTRAPAAR